MYNVDIESYICVLLTYPFALHTESSSTLGRFTLMLSFWDMFKQLESFNARKCANLAKLLAKLIGATEKYLTIGALKRIEFSPSGMSEQTVLFLTILMTTLFEATEDPLHIVKIFAHDTTSNSASQTKHKQRDFLDSSDDEEEIAKKAKATKKEDLSELKDSISVFLLQYLKSSPKDVEGTRFHENLTAAIETCEKG